SGYGQFVEELYPIKQLVDAFEEELHRKLTDDENPYGLLRNYRGMAGRAKIMVEEGAAAIKALKAALPNVNFDNFKTIRMILESVGALDDEEKRKQFSDFLLACSVKDLHNLNNANLKAQAKLERTIERLEDAMDASNDSEERADFKKQIKTRKAQLENLKSQIYATPFDEKTCDGTIEHYKKTYGAAQQDMVKFQNTLLDIMVDSGLLSKENRDEYLTRYPNHVPMFRQFDENENVSFGDSLKMMTGSTRDVIDPLESIVRNTYSFIRRAEKNKAKLALVNLSRVGGAGEIFDEISKPNGATHTSITFYEDGKKKYLDTDASIAKVVNNLSAPHMSWFIKFIRFGTMLLRNFATVYNPAFALRNLVMDDQNAMLYSKYGLFSPADLVKGFLSVFNRDADFQEWMAMGGAQASFWSVDRDYTQASLDKLTKGKWGQYKSVKGFFKLFAVLGEYSELGTRVAYYKKAKKALAAQNGGKIDRTTLITAALESRDLTDFARGGEASRTWNSLAAFANASIQGWDKFFRTFDPRQAFSKDKKVRQEWQRAMFRLAVGSILPTVLCFMINSGGDDDWYEKDLPDWERQTHWILGENVRVPKGQDVGLRFFSNLTESILRSMSGDKKAFQNWWKPAYESLPDLMPTAIQPIVEC
ncbi:MAG: hypothetical protein IJP68_09120, partial [Selenomonadaceae bacterium]|nr:hypothetical protein [Selenomonadaceae bacterium]